MEETRGKAIRCKAAVCWSLEEDPVIEEIEVAPPKPWEVRIKILCTSPCHTDLTFWKLKEPPLPFPRILGHEASGIVESVGDEVKEVQEGDLVVPVCVPQCDECPDCRSDRSNICSNIQFQFAGDMVRDGTSRFTIAQTRQVVYHSMGVSSFSQYTVVDVANVVKVHPSIPPEIACLLSCGISTGVGAAWKVANVEAGSTVAIFGLGTVGLAVAEGARVRGAAKIIGVDINPDKFELGKQFGLTDFINPKELNDKPLNQVLKEMTNGGADYCFECAGIASLIKEAFLGSRTGWGLTVILGVGQGDSVSFNSFEIITGKMLTGSLLGGVKPKTDIPFFGEKYLEKELRLEGFITHELNFQDINKALDLLFQGIGLRCIIRMDG
ncbi:hypothetical protein AMTRI_Chr04g181530 [Amborella trichopoda]